MVQDEAEAGPSEGGAAEGNAADGDEGEQEEEESEPINHGVARAKVRPLSAPTTSHSTVRTPQH